MVLKVIVASADTVRQYTSDTRGTFRQCKNRTEHCFPKVRYVRNICGMRWIWPGHADWMASTNTADSASDLWARTQQQPQPKEQMNSASDLWARTWHQPQPKEHEFCFSSMGKDTTQATGQRTDECCLRPGCRHKVKDTTTSAIAGRTEVQKKAAPDKLSWKAKFGSLSVTPTLGQWPKLLVFLSKAVPNIEQFRQRKKIWNTTDCLHSKTRSKHTDD